MSELYDKIGPGYESTRATDPRLAAAIWGALGDARSVVNVGAGTGHYEPPDREVVAVEPSDVMIAQRPPGAAPCVQGSAEALPFPDGSFDAAMAVLTVHHWRDQRAGLRELRRVARRVVIFGFDPGQIGESWLGRDYFPGLVSLIGPRLKHEEATEELGPVRVLPVPIPHDCRDGFLHAYWRRPEAYLDPRVRAGISAFSQLDASEVRVGVMRLAADLESGAWSARNADLLRLESLDLGYRLVVAV